MHCRDAQELFSDYIEGLTDRALTVTLENHLRGCCSCREEVTELRAVWAELDSTPRVELPDYFHENLMSRVSAEIERLQEQEAAPRNRRWSWSALLAPRTVAYAASFLVIALAGTGAMKARRADFNPLGWVVRILHPVHESPFVQPRVEWIGGENGGSLVIHRPATAAGPATGSVSYRVTVGGGAVLDVRGAGSAEKEPMATIPMSSRPDSVTVSLAPTERADMRGSEQSFEIPLTP